MARDTSSGLLVGGTLGGRYRLTRRLGVEPFGTAHLAEPVDGGRTCMLRILPGTFAEEDPLTRGFLRQVPEAQERSRSHPTFVALQEAGRSDDGRLFVVLEHPGGRRLDDVLREDGPLDLARALRLAIQIGEGLEVAYNLGCLQLPITPQSISIVGREEVKLLGSERVVLKKLGVLDRFPPATEGSGPVAPEQRIGGPFTDRTAVYGYAVVLHQVLSGVVTPGDAAGAPQPLRKLRPEIPGALEGIVMQALDPRPSRRPASVTTVLNDLSAELVRLGEPRGAPRRRLAALAGLASVLVAGGAWLVLAPRGHGSGGTDGRQAMPSAALSKPPPEASSGGPSGGPSGGLSELMVEPVTSTSRVPAATSPVARGIVPAATTPTRVPAEPVVGAAGSVPALPVAPPRSDSASRRPAPVRLEQAPPPRREDAPSAVSPVPSPPPRGVERPETARREPETPDPGAIIDWLLNDSPPSN